MHPRIGILAAVAAIAAGLASAGSAAPNTGTPPTAPTQVRAAFFANWDRYARGYFVKDVPADRLNVLDYAFAFPSASGTCALSAHGRITRRRRRPIRASMESPTTRATPTSISSATSNSCGS